MLLFPAANAAFFSATDTPRETEVVNQSDTVQQVNTSQQAIKFYDNETVNYTDDLGNTVELTEGPDYQWFTSNGSIRFNESSSNVSAGDNATIAYSYIGGSDSTWVVYSLFTSLDSVVGLLLAVVCFGALLNFTFGSGGF